MHWTEEQKSAINRYTSLDDIPLEERRYKCHSCHHIVDEEPCPACGEMNLQQMCPVDHCHCPHDIVETLAYCPLCNAPICPLCGSHDVSQISRITGYLSDVTGWNAAKQQELKDRAHYDIG